MSDEERKKALEQHIRIANYVDSSYCDSVSVDLLQETFDLIDRLEFKVDDLNGKLEKFKEYRDIKNEADEREIERLQAENEQLKRNLKQCENGYSQELHLARCKIEELKNLCTSEDKLIKELRAENERLKAEVKGFDNFLKETDCSLKEIRDNAIKECVNKYTEMLIDEYHLRTDLQIAGIKRLEQKVLKEMVGGENEKSN